MAKKRSGHRVFICAAVSAVLAKTQLQAYFSISSNNMPSRIPYDEIRDFPKQIDEETIFCLDHYIFTLSPFMWGHVCVNVQMMLNHGINGIIALMQQRLTDPSLNARQKAFLCASIRERQAALRYEMRHKEYYRALAEAETDPAQKAKYEDISERIGRVPADPSTNFKDALQSICFMYLCLHAEDVGGHTIGRIDQILYPQL